IFPRGIVADYILIYYYSTKIYTNATVWKNLHAKLGKICTKKEQPWGKIPKDCSICRKNLILKYQKYFCCAKAH
ncbi:MAG: hypothetical protein IKC58_00475, partial [Clostridia bacterium]|nr:hypothetical protein [Clostridia bacterium]